MSVPKLNVSQAYLDKFAQDLEKLSLDAAFKVVPKTEHQIPAFQRQGFLEKLGHTRKKWFKRFFVLRDSFLLSYNLEKSELTVEPRGCIHLAHCKVSELEHPTKVCFILTTNDKEEYEFSVATKEERAAWMKDLQIARMITHANMVKLAVENKCIADEKGLGDVALSKSASALAIFANQDYVRQTPMVGGCEGWIYTPGFNVISAKSGGVFAKVKWFKGYVVLRDSHILLFRTGDTMSKPRGCMYLVGTTADVLETEEKGLFGLVVKSTHCGDLIEMATDNEAMRTRWINALRIGARVTYRDFKLLLKEHELLSNTKPPVEPGKEVAQPTPEEVRQAPPAATPLINDERDIQGKMLDPGAVQPYTQDGNPILRDPEGRLIDSKTGLVFDPKLPRYSQTGQQLDPFNRPLPVGARPMYTKDGQAIGVGVDGQHYLADGSVVAKTDPHYDAEGNELPQRVVDLADGVMTNVNIAIKVRAHMAGDGQTTEAVDQLGRTFRDMNADRNGMIVNADGIKVPLTTARVMDRDNKEFTDIVTHRNKEIKTHREQGTVPFQERKGKLAIVVEDEETGLREIGQIDVQEGMVLADLRQTIEEQVVGTDFVFMANSLPLSESEEAVKYALSAGATITIRPRNELSSMHAQEARARADKMKIYEAQKRREAEEFHSILAAIQSGTYLKPVKKALPQESATDGKDE